MAENEELKNLLVHWWQYYGNKIYTFDELEKFIAIIDEYGPERVMDVAVASYICGDGSPTMMLQSIRADKVSELFKQLPSPSKMNEEAQKQYHELRQSLIETYKESMSA